MCFSLTRLSLGTSTCISKNRRCVIRAGDRWWWSVPCGSEWFVSWFGAKRTKTLFTNTAHNLRLFVLSNSVVVASNTHITHTMKGQDSTLLNIRSSKFISPPMLISCSYSCVCCVGPCVYAGVRSKDGGEWRSGVNSADEVHRVGDHPILVLFTFKNGR